MKLEEPKVKQSRLTWTQLRKFSAEAKQLLLSHKKPQTVSMYFLAMLALLATPGSVEGISYWSYVPQPPILHLVHWMDSVSVKVLTNDTIRMGGFQDSNERKQTSSFITFEGRSDALPICFSLNGKPPNGCLKVSYRTLLTDAPDPADKSKRWVWEMQMQTLGFPSYNETFEKKDDMPLDSCISKYRDKDQFWDASLTQAPTWLTCGFSHAAMRFAPRGEHDVTIWDYSASSGDKQYENVIKTKKEDFHGYTWVGMGEKLTRWFSPGFVESIWVAEKGNETVIHPSLFRLIAASNMLIEKRPNKTKSEPIGLRACVSYPYAILLGEVGLVNIRQEAASYHVYCHSCKLTNCISSSENKQLKVMLLVQRPPFVMLPVELGDEPWYDNSALQVLYRLNELIRPKRFVAALILGIAALISILTTFAVATTALVQEIQTAHFVESMNNNITLALKIQAAIDNKLEAKINILEEAVLAIGQDVANLKTMMATKCHNGYTTMCITPLPYNESIPWEKTKAHLLGLWQDASITHDMEALQKDITAMSQAHAPTNALEALAQSIQKGMESMSSMDWTQNIMHWVLIGGLCLICVLCFPILFNMLFKAVEQVEQTLYERQFFSNRKGGTAASTGHNSPV